MHKLVLLLIASFAVFSVDGFFGNAIWSYNYPLYRIGVRGDGSAAIMLHTLERFYVERALNGRSNAVSLRPVSNIFGNKYLRHRNFVLMLDQADFHSQLFKDDASFVIHYNHYFWGYVSFESTNYPGYFLRHQGYTLKLQQADPYNELFRKDASFKIF